MSDDDEMNDDGEYGSESDEMEEDNQHEQKNLEDELKDELFNMDQELVRTGSKPKYYKSYIKYVIRYLLFQKQIVENEDLISMISKKFYKNTEFDNGELFVLPETSIKQIINEQVENILVDILADILKSETEDNSEKPIHIKKKANEIQKNILKSAEEIFKVLFEKVDLFPDVRYVQLPIEFLIEQQNKYSTELANKLAGKGDGKFDIVEVYTEIYMKKLEVFKDINMNFSKYEVVKSIISQIVKEGIESEQISEMFNSITSKLSMNRYTKEDSVKLEHMKLLYCIIIFKDTENKSEEIKSDFLNQSFSFLVAKYSKFIDLSMNIRADISENPATGAWNISEMFDYFINLNKSSLKFNNSEKAKKDEDLDDEDYSSDDEDDNLNIVDVKNYVQSLYANSINVAKFSENINTLDKYALCVNDLVKKISEEYNVSVETLKNLTDIEDIGKGDIVEIKSNDEIKYSYEKTFVDKLRSSYKTLEKIIKKDAKDYTQQESKDLEDIISFYKSEVSDKSNKSKIVTDNNEIFNAIKYNYEQCKSLKLISEMSRHKYTNKLYNTAGYNKYTNTGEKVEQIIKQTSRTESIQYIVRSVKGDYVELLATGNKKLVIPKSYIQKIHSENNKSVLTIKPILNTRSYTKQIKNILKFSKDLGVNISDIKRGQEYYHNIYIQSCFKWLSLNNFGHVFVDNVKPMYVYNHIETIKSKSKISVVPPSINDISFIFYDHYYTPAPDNDSTAINIVGDINLFGLEYVIPIDNLLNKLYKGLKSNGTIYKDIYEAINNTEFQHFFILNYDYSDRNKEVYYKKLPINSEENLAKIVLDQSGTPLCKILILSEYKNNDSKSYTDIYDAIDNTENEKIFILKYNYFVHKGKDQIVYYQKLPLNSNRPSQVVTDKSGNQICKIIIQNNEYGDDYELLEFMKNLKTSPGKKLNYNTVKAWSEYIGDIKIVTTDFDEYLNLKLKNLYKNCVYMNSRSSNDLQDLDKNDLDKNDLHKNDLQSSKYASSYISGYIKNIIEIEGYLNIGDKISKDVTIMLNELHTSQQSLKKNSEDFIVGMRSSGLERINSTLLTGPELFTGPNNSIEVFCKNLETAIFDKSIKIKEKLGVVYDNNITEISAALAVNNKLVYLSIPEIFSYTFNNIKYSDKYYENSFSIHKDLTSVNLKGILLDFKVERVNLDKLLKKFENNVNTQILENNILNEKLGRSYEVSSKKSNIKCLYKFNNMNTDYDILQKISKDYTKLFRIGDLPQHWSHIEDIDAVLHDINNIIMWNRVSGDVNKHTEQLSFDMMRSVYIKIKYFTEDIKIKYSKRLDTVSIIYNYIKPMYIPNSGYSDLLIESEEKAKNLEEIIFKQSNTINEYNKKLNNFKINYEKFITQHSKEIITMTNSGIKISENKKFMTDSNNTFEDGSKFIKDIDTDIDTVKPGPDQTQKNTENMEEISIILSEKIVKNTHDKIPFDLITTGIYVKRLVISIMSSAGETTDIPGKFMYNRTQMDEYTYIKFSMLDLHQYISNTDVNKNLFETVFTCFQVKDLHELVSLITFSLKDTSYLNMFIYKKIGVVDRLPAIKLSKIFNNGDPKSKPQYRSVYYDKFENFPVPMSFINGKPVFSGQQEVMIKYHIDSCTMSPWLSSRYSKLSKEDLPYIIDYTRQDDVFRIEHSYPAHNRNVSKINRSVPKESSRIHTRWVPHKLTYDKDSVAGQFAETSKYYVELFFSDPHYNKIYTLKVGVSKVKHYGFITIIPDYNIFEESRVAKIISDQGLGSRLISLEEEQDHMYINLQVLEDINGKEFPVYKNVEIGRSISTIISDISNHSLINTIDLAGDIKGRYKENGLEIKVWDWKPNTKYTNDTKIWLEAVMDAKNILKGLAREYGSDRPVYLQKFIEMEKKLQKIRVDLPSEKISKIKIKTAENIWTYDAPKEFAEDWKNNVNIWKNDLEKIEKLNGIISQEYISAKYHIEKNMLYRKNWYLSFYDFVSQQNVNFIKDAEDIQTDVLDHAIINVDFISYTELFVKYKLLILTDYVKTMMKDPRIFVKNYYRIKNSPEEIVVYGVDDNDKKFSEKITQEKEQKVYEISLVELFKNMNKTTVMSKNKTDPVSKELNEIIKNRNYDHPNSLYTFLRALIEYKYDILVEHGCFVKTGKQLVKKQFPKGTRRPPQIIKCTNMSVYVEPIDVLNYMGDSFAQNEIYKKGYINDITWESDLANTKKTMVITLKHLTIIDKKFQYVNSDKSVANPNIIQSSYLTGGRTIITLVDSNLSSNISVSDNISRRLSLICDIDLNDIIPMLDSNVARRGSHCIVKEDVYKFIRMGSVRGLKDPGSNLANTYKDRIKGILNEMRNMAFDENFITKSLRDNNLGISNSKYLSDIKCIYNLRSYQAKAEAYRGITIGEEDIILSQKYDPDQYIEYRGKLLKKVFKNFNVSEYIFGKIRTITQGVDAEFTEFLNKKYIEIKNPNLYMMRPDELQKLSKTKQVSKMIKRSNKKSSALRKYFAGENIYD